MDANFKEEMQSALNRIDEKEEILGKGLCQPFVDCNSGSRKLMFAIHIEQSLPLVEPEVPFVMTGYEQEYADRSSSIIKADSDFEVVGKVSKFANCPNHHYYLILRNLHNNNLSMIERKEYTYSTETYGYAYDNNVLDNLDISYEVPKGEMLRKSTAYDEYMNPMDTVNLLATYVATDVTMEDSMWISESAQKKLSSRLYKKVTVNINVNDIMLNLMGDDTHYKSFPFVGESIKDGILCAVRREKTEESLFTQSVDMLQRILMSDDKYTPGDNGIVIDMDVYCNNPDMLKEKYSNSQILECYNERIRFISEFVDTIDRLMRLYGLTIKDLDYELGEMYYKFKQELKGVQFRGQKVYDGVVIDFIIKEINVPSIGDKLANRYGGKGVIAKILPDDQMPRLTLTGEPLEVLINSSTCVNRENVGQWHELSLTHVGKCITDIIKLGYFDNTEAIVEIIKFLGFCSPKEAESFAETVNALSDEDRDIFLQSILDSGNIIMSIKPMTESMSLDMLTELYKAFPYVTQRRVEMPVESSTGRLRFVPARRSGVIGHIAMYRLQQYAEEKFSVTSLSSTNLRNENSRNKANKHYKAIHQATPINFGDMEMGDLGHAGFENVITLLMIHSVSPHARRLVEQMFIDDPYLVDIKLDENSSNRSAEILATYLKAIGYKLEFEKRKKTMIKPFTISPFTRLKNTMMERPFTILKEQTIRDPKEYFKWLDKCNEIKHRRPFLYKPFWYEDEKKEVEDKKE